MNIAADFIKSLLGLRMIKINDRFIVYRIFDALYDAKNPTFSAHERRASINAFNELRARNKLMAFMYIKALYFNKFRMINSKIHISNLLSKL